MNSKIEVCRVCPVQCRLEERSSEIVTKYNNGNLPKTQVRASVSKMSQEANQIGCPNQEIVRIRRETLQQIDPALTSRKDLKIGPSIQEPPYYIPRPTDSYLQYRFAIKTRRAKPQ